jgi:YD repeat-containing protein
VDFAVKLAGIDRSLLLGFSGQTFVDLSVKVGGIGQMYIYMAQGLLATFTDANNNTPTFQYDSLGRLTRDTDDLGGFTSLERLSIPFGYEVRDSSAEGRVKVYRTQNLPDGTTRKEIQECCGGSTVVTIAPGGEQISIQRT